MMKQTLMGAVLVIILFILPNSIYVISETERGVLLKFGEVVRGDLSPGLHFKVPFVDNVRRFDGRILTVDSNPERFFTQEKKALIVDSYAKFRVTDTSKFYTATSGEEIRAASLLAQRINDDLRNQVAARTVQEVVSGERDQFMEAVKARLNQSVLDELGVEVIDVRVKKIDLPPEVSESVYRRMNAEREKEARELRSEGKEIAEGMRAEADRKVTVIEAEAIRDAEIIRGQGDAEATRVYADSFNQDSEFYAFVRSLNAYQETFSSGGDIMLLQPDSQFFQYLRDPNAGK
ncbi:MAG: protease modulator HflC [Halieaceae bacterium MED-G27]|jgi:membrane protease subunit HflC|nr:protease modulator HflC [Halieaceae bacterium]MAV74293.1 protease modulator HflC [Halieaceae bacterium]OUT65323.1 MAG: protease modulator HflC [Cellvibrionales bacterium TMED21]PDH38607.1 MAG: protease modulator HflC [Halieaceae bacterium MED-G27]|tara:strand:- start:1210 stop:2082 length:873 start_codon:yes stop_codon:yes gene_type:complete